MDLDRIKSLIDAMADSDLAEMEFRENGWSLRLVRTAPGVVDPPPAAEKRASRAGARPQPAKAAIDAKAIRAPMFGVVYLAPRPDAPPLATPGRPIEAGETLYIIETMKVFSEIRAERSGVIESVLVESGQEVEAGQQIMRWA